jgi:hypothetical protein
MSRPRSPQNQADEEQYPLEGKRRGWRSLSLEQMIAWTAAVNLLISLVFSAFPSLYPCDGPFLARFGMFITQFTLPLYTVQLIGILVT